MKDLEKYIKGSTEKMDAVPTTVSIRRDQKEFVDRNGYNLSAMVRDMLSAMMGAPVKGGKRGG